MLISRRRKKSVTNLKLAIPFLPPIFAALAAAGL
jgi:hypothetical protein